MEIESALKILRLLSDGVEPTTGEIFPPDSSFQKPDTIRALCKTVDFLERKLARDKFHKNLFPKAGTPWTKNEDEFLAEDFDQAMSVSDLSNKHGRTLNAIKARLFKLGKISKPDADSE
jgi:hypothetical protein